MSNLSPFSVIIPTFNRAGFLPRAIDSVLSQKHLPNEIIIVDDGSTDSTKELLDKYQDQHPNLIKPIYQENFGVSSARNLGINRSSGEWISFLDSDDRWLDIKLEHQYNYIKEFPETKIIHNQENWIRNGQHLNQCKHHQKFGGYIFEKCLPLCVISPSAVSIHRSVFDVVGLFNTEFPVCEDYELWLRITYLYPVAYLTTPLIEKHGGHEDQLSKGWGFDTHRVKALENILKHPIKNNERKAVLEILCQKTLILHKGYHKHGKQGDAEYYLSKYNSYRLELETDTFI